MVTDFIYAFAGGVLIGLAAVILMASRGRIMGISGIVSQLLPSTTTDWHWRVVFIAGVLAAPPFLLVLTGEPPELIMTHNVPLILLGGFLVGLGTVVGSGCTSGHGVCGLPRLSKRSIAATITFMASAMLTVFAMRHWIAS